MTFFLLFAVQVFGQKEEEYQVYSTLINSFEQNYVLILDKSVKSR